MDNNKPLTEEEKAFILEYLEDPSNGTQAVKRAGIPTKNAGVTAYHLLHRPHVQAEIQRLQKEKTAKLAVFDVTIDRIVQEYAAIAFGDPREVVQWSEEGVVQVRESTELTTEQAKMVSAVCRTRQGLKINLHSKLEALRDLGKHLGMFIDVEEIRVSDELKQVLTLMAQQQPEAAEVFLDTLNQLRTHKQKPVNLQNLGMADGRSTETH